MGVFVLDADTDECLHYEAVAGIPLKKHVRIPREALSKHGNVYIRNDLIDCGIDICSVEVRMRVRPISCDYRFFFAGAVVVPGQF